MLLVVEDIGHGQHVPLIFEVAQGTGGNLGHFQRAGLDLGDTVSLAAQGAVGEDLDGDGAVGLLLHGLGPGGHGDVDRVVLRQIVGQPEMEYLLSVGVGLSGAARPAAGGQRAEKSGAQHAGQELLDSHF